MDDRQAYFEYLKERSRLALAYRRWWLYPRLCRHLSGKVLDVGCGIGDMLGFRPNTVGVDINTGTVGFCRQRGLDARLMEPDSLPFPDASFDGAICDNVLEHIAVPAALLAEIRRVLTPNARFVVGVPGRRGYDHDPDHKVFYDEATLVATLAMSGFTCIVIFHVPFRCAWLDRNVRQYCVYAVFTRA